VTSEPGFPHVLIVNDLNPRRVSCSGGNQRLRVGAREHPTPYLGMGQISDDARVGVAVQFVRKPTISLTRKINRLESG
jgi:hypothetical protein